MCKHCGHYVILGQCSETRLPGNREEQHLFYEGSALANLKYTLHNKLSNCFV